MPTDEIVDKGIIIKYKTENKNEITPGAIKRTKERLRSYLAACLSAKDFGDIIILILHFIQKYLFKRKSNAVHVNRTKANKNTVVKT